MSYYNRRWSLRLNNEEFISEAPAFGDLADGEFPRDFRVEFEVLIDAGAWNTYLDLRIYNLKDDSVNQLVRGAPITFLAGYIGSTDIIFDGRIRNVFRDYAAPSRVTRIIARGGTIDPQRLDTTLPANSTVVDAITEVARVAELTLVIDEQQFANETPFTRGHRMRPDALAEMRDLAQSFNLDFVVENNNLVVTKSGMPRSSEVRQISFETGMEGIPEITEVGCDVNLRLSPDIQISSQFEINSELKTFEFSNLYFVDVPENAGSGTYISHRIRHSGDSWGGLWNTRIEGIYPGGIQRN